MAVLVFTKLAYPRPRAPHFLVDAADAGVPVSWLGVGNYRCLPVAVGPLISHALAPRGPTGRQ